MRGRAAAIIAAARALAAETPGVPQDALVIEILARMVDESTRGVSAGFLRLPPGRPVEINPRQPRSLEE